MLKMKDVSFYLLAEPEEESYADHFMNVEDIALVKARLESGMEWAWFTAHVIATWTDSESNERHGHSYLGCCSYDGEQEFRQNKENFDTMKADALADLNRQLSEGEEKLTLTALHEAAPALLESLEHATAFVEALDLGPRSELPLQQYRAAIAQARGHDK